MFCWKVGSSKPLARHYSNSISPVLPSPHCTSSSTYSATASSHTFLRPSRNTFVQGWMPPGAFLP